MKTGNTTGAAAIFAGLFFAAVGPALAAKSSSAQFLSLGFGARALGMGEAFVAIADDPSSIYYNPAGLALREPLEKGAEGANTKNSELLISHSWHIQDTGLTQLAYISRSAGFSLTYFSAGSLEGRDDAGNIKPDFTADDIAFSGGYALKTGPLMAGGAIKALRQRIDSSAATALCADAGVLYGFKALPLTLGLSMSNIGTRVKFEHESFPLPVVYRAGLALRTGGSFPGILSAEIDLPNDSSAVFRAGVEYTGFKLVAFRAGYRTTPGSQRSAISGKGFGDSQALSELYGFFMGLGFTLNQISIDYALLPYGELGNSHRFSLNMKF